MINSDLTLPIFISLFALLIAGVQGLAGWRTARVSVSQLQFLQMETLHRARIEELERSCEDFRRESATYRQHVELCQQELDRLRGLFEARGWRDGGP
jgi:hypothetical protein